MSKIFINPEHEFIAQEEDFKEGRKVYGQNAEAPEGYYAAGKELIDDGNEPEYFQVFKKLEKQKTPESSAPAAPKAKPKPKQSAGPANVAPSREITEAKERVKAYEASQTNGSSQPYAQRGLMERLQGFSR
jgi:hypothetical protein